MFGTRAADSTLYIAINIALGLVIITLLCIYIKTVGNNIVGIIGIIFCVITLAYISTINIYSKKQGTDNIKEAITDNYSNAENILVQFDRNTKNNKGYFTSDDGNFSFEVINNTLVIKDGETVVKYISGNNY
jgi:hypothetical protein